MLNCFENLSVEPIAGEPKMCRLVFKGKTKGSETFEDRKYIGQPWESIIDSIGTYIGFREKIFYGLTTVVELNLTNKNGKPILIDLDNGSMESVYAIKGKKSIGNGESEVWFGIDIPLDAEFSEISNGTATVRFTMPDEYETVKVNAGDVCKQPVKVSFRDFNLNVKGLTAQVLSYPIICFSENESTKQTIYSVKTGFGINHNLKTTNGAILRIYWNTTEETTLLKNG